MLVKVYLKALWKLLTSPTDKKLEKCDIEHLHASLHVNVETHFAALHSSLQVRADYMKKTIIGRRRNKPNAKICGGR